MAEAGVAIAVAALTCLRYVLREQFSMASIFPAVRGQQRNHDFFQTVMDYGEISDLVKMPEDVLGDQLFDENLTMQRKVNWARIRSELVPYLQNDDAFYSALTLVMIPRDFSRMEEGEGFEFTPTIPNGLLGELKLTSAVYLFPADGQHRAGSIKEALKTNPQLAMQQVPVVLIPFNSRSMVRQLFSDLNLNAKAPNKSIGLSFETRDPVVMIARSAESTVQLFRGRVNHFSNSLPASSANVITVNTLVSGTDDLLRARFGGDIAESLSQKGENSPEFASAATFVTQAWSKIIESLPAWDQVQTGTLKAGQVREDYVLGFGVAWQAIAKAVSVLVRVHGDSWGTFAAQVLSGVDWSKQNPGWQGVCMIGARVNNTGPTIRATAGYILESGNVAKEDNPFAEVLDRSRSEYVLS